MRRVGARVSSHAPAPRDPAGARQLAAVGLRRAPPHQEARVRVGRAVRGPDRPESAAPTLNFRVTRKLRTNACADLRKVRPTITGSSKPLQTLRLDRSKVGPAAASVTNDCCTSIRTNRCSFCCKAVCNQPPTPCPYPKKTKRCTRWSKPVARLGRG